MSNINQIIESFFANHDIKQNLKDAFVGSNITNRKSVDKHLNRATLGFTTAGLGTAIDYMGKVQTDPNIARTIHGIAFPIAVSGATYGMYHRVKADREMRKYLDNLKSELDEHKRSK